MTHKSYMPEVLQILITQGRISASKGPKHDRKGAPNVDIIYHNITYQMQILLNKIKIGLFVFNFQEVYSIFFFLSEFSLTDFFVWLAGWGPPWGRGPKQLLILLVHKFGPVITYICGSYWSHVKKGRENKNSCSHHHHIYIYIYIYIYIQGRIKAKTKQAVAQGAKF